MNTSQTPENFDPLARSYIWLERAAFGKGLQRVRNHHITDLSSSRSILILGDGDGRFVHALHHTNPRASIVSVDNSEKMVERARQRFVNFSRNDITWFVKDALQMDYSTHTFDAVVTHFFLDLFSPQQQEELILKITPSLQKNALWLYGDFLEGHRLRNRIWLKALYTFFRLTCKIRNQSLHSPLPLLKSHGFQLVEHSVQNHGLCETALLRLGK